MCKRKKLLECVKGERERESEKNPLLKKIKIETGNLQLTFVGEKLENKKKNRKVSSLMITFYLTIYKKENFPSQQILL